MAELRCGFVLKNKFAKVLFWNNLSPTCFYSFPFLQSSLSENLTDPQTHDLNCNHLLLYEKWCSTGVAICFTDHMFIDRSYMEVPGDIVVDEKSSRSELQQLARLSSDSSTLIIPRISHPGQYMIYRCDYQQKFIFCRSDVFKINFE
jgi:2,4-dienoyl-CoA reductase-like NADH-dependent reductase (Old Yellow Enzyme family)